MTTRPYAVLFGRLLRAAGFQAITYLSAEVFLADTKQPAFDYLVLDIQLEGISGTELTQRLAASLWAVHHEPYSLPVAGPPSGFLGIEEGLAVAELNNTPLIVHHSLSNCRALQVRHHGAPTARMTPN